tara:strand:+ start:1092 stop:2072 length:981 start_codon:yes stop_codon:yes gene_type:complete
MDNETIEDLGEKELIIRLSKYMPNNQTNDDCASLSITRKNLLINTDLMVEDTHFNDQTTNPRDLGWKSVSTNYSDLISSGCEKFIGINIGLIINPKTKWHWIREFYEGACEALNHYGGNILGGDCSRGINNAISITAIGSQCDLKLRRYSSKPEDIIITTGSHGLSKLGYLLQLNKIDRTFNDLSPDLITQSLSAFHRPKPKKNLLQNIIRSRPNRKRTAIGCTDSSDGFYQAIYDLAITSNCKAIIDYKKLPKHKDWLNGDTWDNYYFYGGEDYELIFSLPKDWADRFLEIDTTSHEIGKFIKGKPSVELKNSPIILNGEIYSHF